MPRLASAQCGGISVRKPICFDCFGSTATRGLTTNGQIHAHAIVFCKLAPTPSATLTSACFSQPGLGFAYLGVDRLTLLRGERCRQRVEQRARARRHQPASREDGPRRDRRRMPLGKNLDEIAALQVREREVRSEERRVGKECKIRGSTGY